MMHIKKGRLSLIAQATSFFYLFLFFEFVIILSGKTEALIRSAGSMSKASAIL